MQNVNPPSHPYVDSVSMNGNQIDLKVEVTDFEAAKGAIEISGQATQVGGAFAPFSQVVDFASDAKEDEQDSGSWFVTVTADVIPPVRFKKDQDITVFARVARVWVTVLGVPGSTSNTQGTDASSNTTWNEKNSAQLTTQSWPNGTAGTSQGTAGSSQGTAGPGQTQQATSQPS